MDEVFGTDSLAPRDRFGGFSDQDPIHVNRISLGKIVGRELVLGWNFFGNGQCVLAPFHLLSFSEISQGNEQVVFGRNLENGFSIVDV